MIVATLIVVGAFSVARAETLTRQLELGMSGSDVSSLQAFLAADPSIYPQGLVTGYFGNLTVAAVSNFQSRNGIASVGRVGPVTLAAINAKMNGGNVIGFDRTAPVIGIVGVSTARAAATTNENASALIYYSTTPISMIEAGPGTSVTISGSTLVAHVDLRTAHSAVLLGLTANTRYYYVIYVRDASGNETITLPSTFQTTN